MRHHFFRPAIAAGLAVALAVSAADGSAAARVTARTVAASVAPAPAVSRSVFLINGDRLLAGKASAGGCISESYVLGNTGGPLAGPADSLRTVTVGDRTFAFPPIAMQYLGRGLDPSLFDVTALAAAESGGRLPVQVTYTGHAPALPGVTITGSNGTVADGYLTAAGAVRFGAALTRQFVAGQAHGSHTGAGMFTGGVSVSLAGAITRTPQPRFQMYTVTVTGTNRAGQPDNTGIVLLFNVDNSRKFDNPAGSIGYFYHGVTKFSVPVGHYWAVAYFDKLISAKHLIVNYVDVLPQFSVTADTTVHTSAQAATSEVQMVTAKPAKDQYVTFQINRYARKGPAVSLGWVDIDGPGMQELDSPATHYDSTLYVNPTRTRPTVGKLDTATNEQLGTTTSPATSRYIYNLAYGSSGTIPPQRRVINQASLATLHVRYYSAGAPYGLADTIPSFPYQYTCAAAAPVFFRMKLPVEQTQYVSTGRGLTWTTRCWLDQRGDYTAGQQNSPQTYLPGANVTEDYGAYPLHPAPYYRFSDAPGAPPTETSASREGNTLRLALITFSDSVPGHFGQGTFPPVKLTGNYAIDQNGQQIAGGNIKPFFGYLLTSTPLRQPRSLLRVTLNASGPAAVNPLSTASHTTWTWMSSHESGARLPAGWTCRPYGYLDTACSVQPMMTLRYAVLGEALDGSASPGQQVVRVWVGHLQLARAAKITSAGVSVSFDGGKTWHAARLTGRGGSYAAVFGAPAGARVTLRTSATDAAGGSVTETITNAYQIAS